MIDLINLDVSPVFLKNYNAFYDDNFKIIVNQGGTRSGKTYSIIQILCLLAFYSEEPLEVSVVSHTLPHLKKGALRDFFKIMQYLGIWEEKKFNKTDLIYRFTPNTFVEFFSADNGDKLRGPSRDILFVNEANLLSYDEWRQLLFRTRHKTFADYNPADEFHWLYDNVLTRNDVKFIQSTYLDNYDFLPKSQIEEIERLRNEDPNYWKIYGLGEKAHATNLIYTRFNVVERMPFSGETIYGLDFGYNSPSALVEIRFYDGVPFVDELIYETKLTNNDLIERMKLLNIRNEPIYADSAETDRIEEIYRAGFNVHKAEKNVKAGVDFCKRYNLHICKNASNIIKEIKSYKWKEDRNGLILDDTPLKFNDHSMDAMRYAMFTHGSKYWTEGMVSLPKKVRTKRNSLKNQLSQL
jgi:phage terminase large subunit